MRAKPGKIQREYRSVEQFVRDVFPEKATHKTSRPEESARKLGSEVAKSILKGIRTSSTSS